MSLTLRSSSAIAVLSMVGLFAASSPAQAGLLRVGDNARGGGIVYDGDSEVRTMNIFDTALDTYTLGLVSDFKVTMTLDNDADNALSPSIVRLILSFDSATAASFSDPLFPLATVNDTAVNPWNTDQSGTGDVFNVDSPLVPFYANLTRVGTTNDWLLTSSTRATFDALRAAYPNLVVHAGIAVEYDPLQLTSCDADGENCNGEAFANFTLTATRSTNPPPPPPVPEPGTLLLVGGGLLSTRFLRRKGSRA